MTGKKECPRMDDMYVDEQITGGDSWDRQKIGQAVKCVNVK